MAELSETYPSFTFRRDAFRDEDTYQEFRKLIEALELFRRLTSDEIADLEDRVATLESVSSSSVILSPITVPPSAFMPKLSTQAWEVDYQKLLPKTTADVYFYAPVFLPDGVTITKVVLCGYRKSVTDTVTLRLYETAIATTNADKIADFSLDSTGWHCKETTDLTGPSVDNDTYQYTLLLRLNADAAQDDVAFSGAQIEFS